MGTSNVSDSVTLSKEVMAAAFNIADLDSFYKEENGEKVLINQKEIDSIVLQKLGEKTDNLIKNRVDSLKSELEGRYKKEIYTEIEKKAFEDFGVNMNWSKDGFAKIKSKLSDTPEIVPLEKQERFISTVQDYEQKLKDLQSSHTKEMNAIQTKEINSSVDGYLVDLFSKDESMLTIRNAEVLKNHARLIRKDLQDEDTFIKVLDNKPMLVDSKGELKLNKDNGFQPYDFDKLSLNLVKTRYNPEVKGASITSPNPASNDPLKEVKTNNGTVMIPNFKTAEEKLLFIDNAEREGQPLEVIKAASSKELSN